MESGYFANFNSTFSLFSLTRLGVADHLDAATVARHQRRLISRKGRVVEGILAPHVRPAVAFVAINLPRWNTDTNLLYPGISRPPLVTR